MDTNQTKQALDIVKALAYTENGGHPKISATKTGKTGEMKSIFQFTPDTWNIYSKQILGKASPLNNETEAVVVKGKVDNWLKEGYQPEQIFSMWNAGEQRPDAYKQNWKGMNKKYGVAFDTPGYVKKAMSYMDQFAREGQTQVTKNDQSPTQNPGLIPQQTPQSDQNTVAESKPGLYQLP